MNPHNDRNRMGYLRGLADAVRALVAVARAREADLRALRQVPHRLGSAKAEVLLDRDAELDSLSQAARAQFRDAVAGRRADRAGQSGRAAVAARAQQMAADALETYRCAVHTPASWNREPRSLSRSDAVSDVTEHASAADARATGDSDSDCDSGDRGSDGSGSGDGGIGVDDDSVPPWQDDAAAVALDRSVPLANWPRWQDAQRVRDPDLVEFAGVVDEVVADAEDSDEWGRWFDENDSLTLIVDDVLEDRRRDTEYGAAGNGLLDTDDRADSATDLDDAGPPHEDPVPETDAHHPDGAAEAEPASPVVVPDPLEQARQVLIGIAADLEHDRWDHDPWGRDRGDSTSGRDVLGDQGEGHGHDPDDNDSDRYDDGRDPW
ncbi:hypothetical protein ACFU8R_10420 [Pseudonocardia alni]|uniref:hypothetical protein n=1 Tax=Pseudonocardia alni TaxID=33907 RepID=UPI003689D1FF